MPVLELFFLLRMRQQDIIVEFVCLRTCLHTCLTTCIISHITRHQLIMEHFHLAQSVCVCLIMSMKVFVHIPAFRSG